MHRSRRAVVTGLGMVSPLGTGVQLSWERLVNGACGISKINHFDCSAFPSQIAGSVSRGSGPHDFDVSKWVEKKELPHSPPFIQFALSAAEQALTDAKWRPESQNDKERTGVSVGTGIGSLDDIIDTNKLLETKGYRKMSTYFIPRILYNLAGGLISVRYGLKGPNHCSVTACATAAHCVGDAARMIEYGDADVMVAGGTESCINSLSVAGFARMKALSTSFNDQPEKASRPFDKDRDGFVIGEGAGMLVLEEYEHAKKRGARIYAEVKGYGLSSDGYHITAPPPDGDGAYRAMRAAIQHAGMTPESVQYVNAHATSTPLGDEIENKAIKRVFGQHAYKLAVSSTKGATGHLLGAAGGVESIFTILAIHTGIVPPTLNMCQTGDPEMDLDYVPNEAQKRKVDVAIKNSFGFGGTNASLLFARV